MKHDNDFQQAEQKIVKQILDIDNLATCIPTFNELLEVEYLRSSGDINMVTEDIARELCSRGLFAGANWVLRCRDHNLWWAKLFTKSVEMHERTHGPKDTWLTEKLMLKFKRQSLKIEKMLLKQKIDELKRKEKELKQKVL